MPTADVELAIIALAHAHISVYNEGGRKGIRLRWLRADERLTDRQNMLWWIRRMRQSSHESNMWV